MNILLNWFPPASVNLPSPAMSILKAYLEAQGIVVDIIYWNLYLDNICKSFTNIKDTSLSDIEYLFPFFAYLQNKDIEGNLDNIISWYQQNYPDYRCIKSSFYKEDILEKIDIVKKTITKILRNQLAKKEYSLIGMSAKLYQIIPAIVFSDIVRIMDKEIPIVIGGIGTKNEAIAIMESFQFFDFAIWGEGEHPLTELCYAINSKRNIQNTPNLVYRKNQMLTVSKYTNNRFLDLDSLRPNYTIILVN